MITLKQLNIVQHITALQAKKLTKIVPGEGKINGKTLIKKINKQFDTLADLYTFKQYVSNTALIDINKILFTYDSE